MGTKYTADNIGDLSIIGNLTALGSLAIGSFSSSPALTVTTVGNFATVGNISADGTLVIGTTGLFGGNVNAPTFIGALTGHASLDLALTGGTLSGLLTGTTIDATTFNGGTFNGTLSGSSTSLAGGTAGEVPYQTGASTTAFTSGAGSSGQVLTSSGGGAPTWTTPSPGGVTSIIAGTNITISPLGGTGNVTINSTGGGGGSYSRSYGTGDSSTTVFTVPTYVLGNNSLLVYQDGILAKPTVDYTETSTTSITFATAPPTGAILSFVVASTSAVGGIAGGSAGEVLFQTGSGTTSFTAVGTTGQYLTSAGTGTPTWTTAGAASSLSGGAAGEVPYQTGVGTTGFTAVGTTGQVLTSAGAGTPTWTTISGGGGGYAKVVMAAPTGSSADTTAINAALTTLGSAGGVIVFREGTYWITSTITITNPGVTFQGQGKDVTILQAQSSVGNASVLTQSGPINYFSMRDLTIDGGFASRPGVNTSDIYLVGSTYNGIVTNCKFTNNASGNTTPWMLWGFEVIQGCDFLINGNTTAEAAVSIANTGGVFSGNTIIVTKACAEALYNGGNQAVTGNYISMAANIQYIIETAGAICCIANNIISYTSGTTTYAILLSASSKVTVMGNISTSTSAGGIFFSTGGFSSTGTCIGNMGFSSYTGTTSGNI